MILNKEQIRKLILEDNLISDYIDLETQLQPNGFDLTIEEIFNFSPNAHNELSFNERLIDKNETICFGKIYNNFKLGKGTYKFKVNETMKLPSNICAISTQRSSFMRMGNICNVGFWDAGYNGSGYSMMQINNPVRIHKNARIIQLYFFELEDVGKTYDGIYQKENVK